MESFTHMESHLRQILNQRNTDSVSSFTPSENQLKIRDSFDGSSNTASPASPSDSFSDLPSTDGAYSYLQTRLNQMSLGNTPRTQANGPTDTTSTDPTSMDTISTPLSSIEIGELLNPDANTITTPSSFATFNTLGYKDADVTLELDSLFFTQDVIGTQEQTETQLGKTMARHGNTHGVIVGNPNDAKTPEYSPIFYDREKFEPVHVEHVDLPPNGSRSGTVAVLRDQESGGLITVSNSHFISSDADSSSEHRLESFELMERKHMELQEEFNCAGHVMLGDFNADLSTSDQMFGDYNGQQTLDNGGIVDGVGVYSLGDDDPSAIDASDPAVYDGGASDHNSVSRSDVTFAFNDDSIEANRALPALNLIGAVTFTDHYYGGTADIIGFGKTESDTIQNDSLSSVWVPPGSQITLYDHSNSHVSFDDTSNPSITFTGSQYGMPPEWNDRVSGVRVSASDAS